MDETSERVQEALAAYLEYLEMGGSKPDTSHLSRPEREELEELIGVLDLTEGIAFGLGRTEESQPRVPFSPASAARVVPSEPGGRVLAHLREALPPDVRIESDATPFLSSIGDVAIADGWILGTLGGRVRVWLLAVGAAQELESNRDCLADLNRVFGAFPETTAVVLVAHDLSSLIVQPEDCGPQINIPSGSLTGRGYSQPVRPVAEAVIELLNELMPYWDPIPAFDRDAAMTIDPSAVGKEFVTAAIESQRGVGQRARKGNPKKDTLLALGEKEVSALTNLTDGLFDGTIEPREIEDRIERLAKDR